MAFAEAFERLRPTHFDSEVGEVADASVAAVGGQRATVQVEEVVPRSIEGHPKAGQVHSNHQDPLVVLRIVGVA